MGLLYDPATTAPEGYRRAFLAGLEVDARTLGLRVQPISFPEPAEVGRVFSKVRRSGVQGLLVDNASPILLARERACALAKQQHLPAIGQGREFADAGCLMSYGENLVDMYRRAATYVDRILMGARPAELPVEQPVKFELVINLNTARGLGPTIPKTLLAQADELVQ